MIHFILHSIVSILTQVVSLTFRFVSSALFSYPAYNCDTFFLLGDKNLVLHNERDTLFESLLPLFVYTPIY